MEVIAPQADLVTAEPASEDDMAAVHSRFHIDSIRECGFMKFQL